MLTKLQKLKGTKAYGVLMLAAMVMICYAVFKILTDRIWVEVRWLFWLGFRYPDYVSYDHFPMLPYIFLFFVGTWMGQMIQEHRDSLPFLKRSAPRWLTWPGRRTLIIYLLHQPVLFGACWLADTLS